MRDLDKIMEKVAHQKAELQYKNIEAKYLFIDEQTYRKLKVNSIKIIGKNIEYTTYLEEDRFMGLLVVALPMIDEFVSVGV